MTKKTISQLQIDYQKKIELSVRARFEAARLKRQMSVVSRKHEAQMLCTLGRAVIRICARDQEIDARFRAFLSSYISRDTDFEALIGTAFEVARPASSCEPQVQESHQ